MGKPAIEQRLCPRIDDPCKTLPHFAKGQRSAFCSGCQKTVFNLSAMTAGEQSNLLSASEKPCVRYSKLIPAMVLAMGSAMALAQDADAEPKLGLVEVTGGGFRGLVEPVFIENELENDPSLEEDDGN